MLEDSVNGFQIVHSRKKKNVTEFERRLEIETRENNNSRKPEFHDEGIGSASPTESEESVEVKKGQQPQTQKSKKKRKKRKNKRSRTDSHESDNEKPDNQPSAKQTQKSAPKAIVVASNDVEHRRRRKSSRGDEDGCCSPSFQHHTPRSVRWEPELVLEPHRVRTSSNGGILVKESHDWSIDSYVCDCGFTDCDCDETNNRDTPEWTSRSLRWKTRFQALAQMKTFDLNCIEGKVYYCDKQQHLKLGSGHTVYLGLTSQGRETCIRKLKSKQLPQLQKPSHVRKLLELRHPNLIRYDEFIILKNQTYLMQELVDYSLGRWLRDRSICQPLEKIDVCRQLCNGMRFLHDQDIAHTDLRPANILITPVGRLTIANFGIAPMNTLNKNKPIAKRIEEIKPSSPECWRALETVWEITDDYKISSDMSPLGMVLFTILTDGQHPYGQLRKESARDALKNLLAPRYCLNLLNNNIVAKELIRHLLHKDPACRPTIQEVLRNPFFWTETQKLDHIRHILTGPKSTAIEKKSARMLIPSCGHFGEFPKVLSAAHNADSGEEAIDALGDAFNGEEGFLKAVLTQLPILLPLTAKHAQHEDEDIGDSESSAKIGELELEFDFDE
jgi:hypothetical protein